MNKKIVQKIVLGGVIFDFEGRVLILQRGNNEKIYPGMWELPSGKKEDLENSQNSLKREIIEETGLKVEPVMPFFVFDYLIEKEEEIRDSVQINYIVKVKNSDVCLSSEHQNFAWIKSSDLENYNLTDLTKQTITKGFLIKDLLKI